MWQDVEKGLQDGKLFKGKLRINPNRRSTAFVSAEGGVLPSDIFLDGEKTRNRAQEGDVVRTELTVDVASYAYVYVFSVFFFSNENSPIDQAAALTTLQLKRVLFSSSSQCV